MTGPSPLRQPDQPPRDARAGGTFENAPDPWGVRRAENLTTGDATQSPLLALLESARNAILSAQVGEHAELWPRYTAMTEVDPGELLADVWQLDFTAGALLAPLTEPVA